VKSRHVVWVAVSIFLWFVGFYLENTLQLCAPATGPRRFALYVAIVLLATWPVFFTEFVRNRIGVIGKVKDEIDELVRSKHPVPKQVESVFIESVKREVDRMLKLARQEPVPDADVNTQYNYASGVAGHYKRHPTKSIGATALDLPSTFFDRQREYFIFQESLTADSAPFYSFARDEARNLKLLIARINAAGVGVEPERVDPLPNKARIVIIDETKLRAELQEPKFWEFVSWHITFKFGLKFLLRDPTHTYEDRLAGFTGIDKEKTIPDFIVYGDDGVFGRINSDAKGNWATLGFHYATDGENTVRRYETFFQNLWQRDVDEFPETHTLTELWLDYPRLRQDIEARVDDLRAIKDFYDAVAPRR
jgi:hypothetical protein